jgi:small subunit ribosomal protein S30e
MVKHGTISKAGKVKKQTPVVEPKDRLRKIPVGRAKKRKQFQKKAAVLRPEATAAARKKYKHNKQGEGK